MMTIFLKSNFDHLSNMQIKVLKNNPRNILCHRTVFCLKEIATPITLGRCSLHLGKQEPQPPKNNLLHAHSDRVRSRPGLELVFSKDSGSTFWEEAPRLGLSSFLRRAYIRWFPTGQLIWNGFHPPWKKALQICIFLL